ncbi:MAG: response regulator, partial [Colwellia sp.]|nr:response regulator [Colwellia sp.]
TGFIRDITKDKQSEAELQANNDELNKENARKTQLAKMNELTQGASDINQLSDDIIANLAKLSHAGHGVIYIANQDNKLKLAGSYAFRERKNILAEIALGEGLVGQCAKEKKVILLTKVPNDYIEINSALGEQVPLNLLLLPILFEQKIMAVIELASFELFSQEQQEILIQIAQNLGVVINNIFNQQRTQELLLSTQQQAEELQTQQEELKSANENLTQQTQELQASEEELRQQSEELKVSNEELEQRQSDLQNQKDKISLAKQELEIKAEELALASKYKSEFLANMSHELRTPLNSLLLLSKSLADNKSNHLDATEVEDAHIIYQGGQSLLALINDILDLSKVEAGKLNIHIETINFTDIKAQLMQLFNPLAKNRELSLNTIIDEKLPSSFHTDSQRLEQILRNLVSNAIKFTEMGGVTISFGLAEANIKFRNSNLSHDNCFVVHVIDTGVGISEDKLQAIFEAFQQEDGSTSRKYGGTGLGLTIARELSHLLGGEIQLSSTLGQGSRFSLYLPLSIEQQGNSVITLNTDNKSIPKHEIKVSAGKLTNTSDDYSNAQHALPVIRPLRNTFIDDDRLTISAGDRTLLVVDDDEVFAKILRDHARRSGYKCLVAGNGLTGIELAKHYQPQGIILDIMLPDIDGHRVLERLKSDDNTRHIPVEIISAHSDDRREALSQGAIGLQTKPVSSEQLQQVLIDIEKMAKAKIKQILIIEDNKHHSKATRRLLENIGLITHCVTTGEEGYQAILTNKYDCVILDLGLPDISGIELLDKLNQNKNKNKKKTGVLPPVIIYTGKEITDQEQTQLDKYSATIVIKGVGSAERLLDDISLFLHQIERDINQSNNNKNKVNMHLLHDENTMLADRKILLVDDDMRNTYALSKQLIDIGFDVDMANNGQEALDMLEKQDDFELILMDTMMPIMDGNQATIKIRKMKNYKNIPIIALTAKTMPEDRENALEAGASEYLTKPLELEKLLSIMRIWLFKKTS